MLPMDALEMPVIPVPPKTLVDSFTKCAAAAGEHVEGNIEQSHTLAALRDALLPKLMSGEIRVREAEAAVEAVL
jgi:type I restriction enzyme S subunit